MGWLHSDASVFDYGHSHHCSYQLQQPEMMIRPISNWEITNLAGHTTCRTTNHSCEVNHAGNR
jgi:hypothetical protein